MAIGPVIKNGFYYDIDCDKPLSTEELSLIEKKIKDLIKTNYEVVRKVVSQKEALDVFINRNEPYKPVYYTHLRAHETKDSLVCRRLL